MSSAVIVPQLRVADIKESEMAQQLRLVIADDESIILSLIHI